MRRRTNMGSSIARLFSQNSDARLAGIAIWEDRPYLDLFTRGPWNRLKNTKCIKYMLIKSRGVFSEGKAPAAGIDHGVVGGTLKSMNIHTNHLYLFNELEFIISTSISWKHQICIQTYPMRGYWLAWYCINPSARGYLLTWDFINLGISWIFFNVDIWYSSDLSTDFINCSYIFQKYTLSVGRLYSCFVFPLRGDVVWGVGPSG